MKSTKYINSKGFPKGAFIYHIKKNGERYKKPYFYQIYGSEKSAEDIIKRLEYLNPGQRFEKANFEELCYQ